MYNCSARENFEASAKGGKTAKGEKIGSKRLERKVL